MEKRVRVMVAVACALACTLAANAQTYNVTVNQSAMSLGYMSWGTSPYTAANFPSDGGYGSSGWGQGALVSVWGGSDGNTLTISPNVNTYAPGNPYWTNPDGSGANTMDASTYDEVVGTYANSTVTFTFNVLSNTLGSDGFSGAYTADAFIKDFGPGYALWGEVTVPLTPGVDTVTYPGTGPSTLVQYGVELIGIDTSPTGPEALQSVVIAPVPEPSTIALVACGLLGALVIRRRQA